MSLLLSALAFAKRIPWQLWAVLALLAAGWIYGNHRYAEGRDDERAKWERVVEEAEDRAAAAERAAQAAHEKRETIREIRTNTIREVARKADNANPEAAGRSFGPVTSSVLGMLREQGSGSEPPAPRVD